MLSFADATSIYVSREPVDFRKAHDGLSQIVRDHFGGDPLSGDVFVFTNKRRDRIKLLLWDRNGLWLFYKRLEQGTLPRFGLRGNAPRVKVKRAWLAMLLDGLEPFSAKVHSHHVDRVRIKAREANESTRYPPSARSRA